MHLASHGFRLSSHRLLLVLGLAVCGTARAAGRTNDLAETAMTWQLHERATTVDARGLKTTRIHERFQILRDEALEYAGDIEVPYNAFYEKARLIRAETRTPDGRVMSIQSEVVRDMLPESLSSFREYSDRRVLAFSMPALVRGATVDYEVEITETKPVIVGQYWDQFTVDRSQPVTLARYVLQAPAEFPFVMKVTGTDTVAVVNTVTGITTRIWEYGNLPAIEYEPGMPPAVASHPAIDVSSITNWQRVDSWFASLAEGRDQASPEIAKLARDLTKDSHTDLERINALVYFVTHSIRYVAVELGWGAYQPRQAQSCLDTRYGDCKDQSTLLMALLRAAGFAPRLALIRPAHYGPVVTEVPSPGQFNHAVVCLPLGNRTLWLDPTAGVLDAESYPAVLDGVQALVIGLPERFLAIPPTDPARNHLETMYDVRLSPDGHHRIRRTIVHHGRSAAGTRNWLDNLTAEKRKEAFEQMVEGENGFRRLIGWEVPDPTPLTDRFAYTVEYVSDGFLAPTERGFQVQLGAEAVNSPIQIYGSERQASKRKLPWVFQHPSMETVTLRVELPPGYDFTGELKSGDWALTQGAVSMRSAISGSVFTASVSSFSRLAVIEPADFVAERRRTERAVDRAQRMCVFVDTLWDALRDEQPDVARARLASLLAAHPDDPYLQMRGGDCLLSVGRIVEARAAYRRAMALDPRVFSFRERLAATYSGLMGVAGLHYDRTRVLQVLEEGRGKVDDPKSLELAISTALATSVRGTMLDFGEDRKPAIAIADRLLKEYPGDTEVLLWRAKLAMSEDDYVHAAEWFDAVLAKQSGNLEAYQGRWRCAALEGDLSSAIHAVKQVFRTSADQLREYAMIAMMLASQRKLDDAVTLLEKSCKDTGAERSLVEAIIEEFNSITPASLRDYSKLFDLSTPEKAAQSITCAITFGDTQRLQQCLSPVLATNTFLASFLQIPVAPADLLAQRRMANVGLASLWVSENVTVENLPANLVRVRVKRKSAPLSSNSAYDMLLRRENGLWHLLDLNSEGNASQFVAVVLLDSLRQNRTNEVAALVAYIGELHDAARMSAERSAFSMVLDRPIADPRLHALALVAAGLLRVSDDAPQLARRCLDEVLISVTNNSAIYQLAAMACLHMDDPASAAELYRQALALEPESESILGCLIGCQLMTGDVAKMETAIAELDRRHPANNIMPLFRKELLTRKGDDAGAWQLIEREIANSHNRLPSQLDLQVMSRLNRTGELAAAEGLLRRKQGALSANRTSFYYAYLMLDRTNDSTRQIEIMLLQNRNNVKAVHHLAQLVLLETRTEEARELAEQALLLANADKSILQGVADIRQGAGDFAEALALYAQAATNNAVPSQHAYAALHAGVCARLLGKPELARQYWIAAASLSLRTEQVGDYAAMLLGRKTPAEIERRIDSVTDRMRQGDFRAELGYYAGVAALLDNRREEAARLFKRSIDTRAVQNREVFLAKAALLRLAK